MSQRSKDNSERMLELWRPSRAAGAPIGCLASTFTFDANLFDEQALACFLDIDADPHREDLSYLLQREDLLGRVYAGILVDHTQADVEHSLRWDVLPVRVPRGRQHAKLSLLMWERHLRIIVSSANLTQAGYRQNREVAATIEATPDACSHEQVDAACAFLEHMLGFVPGANRTLPHTSRALRFLEQVRRRTTSWQKLDARQA
ncbi:MAG: phospholipase D family protein [Phycisphaeraceae bacterium]